MKRGLAVLLAVLIASPGCSTRLASPTLNGVPIVPRRAAPPAPQAITRAYADRLPVGARVKVAVRSGESFSAIYMGVEDDAVRVQKRTRIPEAPFPIPLADLTMLALDEGGTSAAKAALIGVGVGVATFFGILAIAAAAWND